MKRLLAIACLLCVLGTADAQTRKAKDSTAKKEKTLTKYNDNVDDRMKGPNGEKIYIGPNGGRYYLKDGKKVYVEYKGNKKKNDSAAPNM